MTKAYIEMETVVGDNFSFFDDSLAGGGMNTIRKYRGRYIDVGPGDKVWMRYVKAAGDTEYLAQEFLEVSSIVVANLPTLLDGHAMSNHGVGTANVELFKRLYGDTDGLFCAIYFK